MTDDLRRCQWCGHDLRRWAHSPVTIGSAARMLQGLHRECGLCEECESAAGIIAGQKAHRLGDYDPRVNLPGYLPRDTRPAWVRRAMGEGSGALPVKEYR